MKSRFSSFVLLFAILAFPLICSSEDHIFDITDLGTLGGPSSSANHINDYGQVVGESVLPNGQTRAFVYAEGVMWDLGTLEGGNYSTASGINNRGQVVGTASTSSGTNHAFMFSEGIMRDLGTLGGSSSSANAINDQGIVVGEASLPDGKLRAFVYAQGAMTDLGTFGGNYSSALGINNWNQIIGVADDLGGDWNHSQTRGFVFADGYMTDLRLAIAPQTYYYGLHPRAINNTGCLVGRTRYMAEIQQSITGFIYRGSIVEIGFEPMGVNDLGLVVGTIEPDPLAGDPVFKAAINFQGVTKRLDVLVDLQASPFIRLESASSVNNLGQIVGKGITKGGGYHAYLLTLKSRP